MYDLKQGELKDLLDCVRGDDALALEIRDNYLNIYYRGGNLFRIKRNKNDVYEAFFDLNYCTNRHEELSKISPTNLVAWIEKAPVAKAEMDAYFRNHAKPEREFQQLVVRENNGSTISRGTDYYIADIEYANSDNRSRFDMLAVKWKSGPDRRSGRKATLSFMEVKYGDGALRGSAGLEKHIIDLGAFLKNDVWKRGIIEEVSVLFSQKRELGLIEDIKLDAKIQEDSELELILLLANHNPASTILNKELEKVRDSKCYKEMKDCLKCDLKIATASFLGYGLYAKNMIPLEEFLNEMPSSSR